MHICAAGHSFPSKKAFCLFKDLRLSDRFFAFQKNSSYCLKWTAAARHITRSACARCKNKGQGSSAPFRKEQFTFMVAALPQWSQWPQWSPFVVSLLSVAIFICTITYCHLKVNYLSTTSLLFFAWPSIIFTVHGFRIFFKIPNNNFIGKKLSEG